MTRVQTLVLLCCFLVFFVSQSLFFFFCMRESEENRSMLWNDKGSAVKFNVMLLILFLWRGDRLQV